MGRGRGGGPAAARRGPGGGLTAQRPRGRCWWGVLSERVRLAVHSEPVWETRFAEFTLSDSDSGCFHNTVESCEDVQALGHGAGRTHGRLCVFAAESCGAGGSLVADRPPVPGTSRLRPSGPMGTTWGFGPPDGWELG